MSKKLSLILATALMMFPQIVETIYSPALTDIAEGFNASAEQTAQTLSLYFFAFAFGVVFWGRLCDQIGRRPVMLAGLLLYGVSSLTALFSHWFTLLLIARMLSAFGAAVGSIGTQTIIRDTYQGKELASVFSIMGIALAVSPAIGLLTGATLTHFWGYIGVFAGLTVLAILLVGWSTIGLPETRPTNIRTVPLIATLVLMIQDKAIWRTALLIAFFNICLFSYYQLAPFHFAELGLSPQMFGYSGLLLALGVCLGSWVNKYLLQQGWPPARLVLFATLVSLISSVITLLCANHWFFIVPIIAVVMAYGIAIPNILALALTRYTNCQGTAGALLGLLYYLMIGSGLALAGWNQNLGLVLVCCSSLALPLAISHYFSHPTPREKNT